MSAKDTRHWSTRQEAKRDEVREALSLALAWVLARRTQAAWAAGGAAAAALVAVALFAQRRNRFEDAWDRYALSELYAYGGRPQESLAAIKSLADDHPGTPASAMAKILEGDILYPRGDYAAAEAAYARAAEEGGEALRPFAQADRAMALEAAGKHAEAEAAAQALLDAAPDHFLAPLALSVQARSRRAAGKAEEARQALQKLALQFPDSPWAAWANAQGAAAPPAAK